MKIPESLIKRTKKYADKIGKYSPKLSAMYEKCYLSTIETCMERLDDGTVFLCTGDIPAMWLRDSTAQVSHYIPAAVNDEETAGIIKGVIARQRDYLKQDPYANAFKKEPDD